MSSVSSHKHYQLGYRADIEGLRAVAIILVVCAHAGVSLLKGGFVGVDVFFVLSGYLITGLLINEALSTGRIGLLAFYARRLKRLLPALLFMTIGVILLAALLLAPFEQLPQTETAVYAPVWATNFYFSFSNLDYFGPTSATNLFLHTWSLSVEEQFYLVWPALLMLLLGIWGGQKRTLNMRRLTIGLVIIVIVGLLISALLSYVEPLWAFYLMPSRAWQFGLGALAWLASHRRRSASPDKGTPLTVWQAWLLGLLGIALILGTGVLLSPNTTYPGFWAALPSLGAALVLYVGSFGSVVGVSRLLAIRPMQMIGNVSYAWYLWHWPLIVLGDMLFGTEIPNVRLVMAALSLGVAVFSFFVVENPVRHHPALARRTGLIFAGAAVLTALGVGLGFGWRSVATAWTHLPAQQIYTDIRKDLPKIYSLGCDTWYHSAAVTVCDFGDKNAPKTAVLLGDSVLAQWSPALIDTYSKNGWRTLVVTKSSCPIVDETVYYAVIGQDFTVCDEWRDAALTKLGAIKPDLVFMGSASTYHFSQTQWVSGTQRILDRLAPVSGQVYIVRGTYRLPFSGPDCLARRKWQPAFIAQFFKDCSAPAEQPLDRNVYAWLKSAAGAYPNVSVLDWGPLVCPDGRCYAERDGQIAFRDIQHLTTAFVSRLTDSIAADIDAHATAGRSAASPADIAASATELSDLPGWSDPASWQPYRGNNAQGSFAYDSQRLVMTYQNTPGARDIFSYVYKPSAPIERVAALKLRVRLQSGTPLTVDVIRDGVLASPRIVSYHYGATSDWEELIIPVGGDLDALTIGIGEPNGAGEIASYGVTLDIPQVMRIP